MTNCGFDACCFERHLNMASAPKTVIECAHAIADGHHAERESALEVLRTIAAPDVVETRDTNQLRAIDILARGHDDEIAAAAVEVLADAGSMIAQAPSIADAPPLHAACYFGSWMMARALLEYEVTDVHQPANSRGMRLLGGFPVHAVAAGFRAAKAEGFANCLQLLLHNGADINARDKLRKRPVDIALTNLVATGDRSLVDALFSYGVATNANPTEAKGAVSAIEFATAMAKKGKDEDLGAAALKSAIMNVSRHGRKLHDEQVAAGEIEPAKQTSRPTF